MDARTLRLGSLLAATVALPALAQELHPTSAIPPKAPPLVAAIFYPWYDATTGAHFERTDGADALRHHFVDPSIVRPDSVAWFEQEVDDAAEAGLDALLVVSAPAPATAERWMPALRQALENREGRLARPLRVALLLDPGLVAFDRAGGAVGGPVGGPVAKLDLGDPFQRADFFAPVERFFTTFPPALQATVDGSPLLVIGAAGAIAARPEELLPQIEQSVAAIAGRRPWLVLEKSWNDLERPQWRTGSALLGVQRAGEVVCLGPGWDGRSLPGPAPLLRLREEGATYQSEWQRAFAARARLVLLESWNQMEDGTALCTTTEHGRSYLERTRRACEQLRAGVATDRGTPALPALPLLAESFADDRALALADVARFLPGVESAGVRIDPPSRIPPTPGSDAQLSFMQAADSTPLLRIAPRAGATSGRVRFRVSRVFLGLRPAAYDVDLDATAGDAPVDVAIGDGAGAARTRLRAGESRVVAAQIVAPPSLLRLEIAGGALEVRSLTLRRRTGRLPDSRIGISDPSLFTAPDRERLATARALGAAWFRCEVSWAALAPDAASCDVTRVVELVAAIRAAGMEPLIALGDPPAWAQPVAEHPDDVARVVGEIASRCGDELRLLELFPGANRSGSFARVEDAQGYVRVLRAAAKAAHAANPRLAIVLGGVEGPDTTWIGTIEALRARFQWDAVALLANDEGGEIGGKTFLRSLTRTVDALRGDAIPPKPFFLEVGATTSPSPLLAKEARALLPESLAAAWKQLGREASPVHLLDAPDLPRVRGLATDHARALLEAAGITVIAEPLDRLLQELSTGKIVTLLLASGEIVPSALLPALPTFLDRGGLLVTLGGAPFRRPAEACADGAFELAEDPTPALALRDELRIALARFRPQLDAERLPGSTPIRWTSGRTVPGLAERCLPTPGDSVLFTERTGLPRNDHGFHRYEPLLVAQAGDAQLGDVVALIAFSGARRGALLLIGVDADDHGISEPDQAAALRRGFTAALDAGARVVFWSGLADAPTARSGGGLLRADGTRREAAETYAELARAEAERSRQK